MSAEDRELLELAAKAADIKITWGKCAAHIDDYEYLGVSGPWINGSSWNPLANDGDALRLAVKLGLMVDIQNTVNATSVWTTDDSGAADFDAAHGTDPYAATRRAIVRAAAEIGKAMP